MNPLDQLADIRLPEEVSFWPLALGYWLVAFALIALILLSMFIAYKRRIRLAARKRSLFALDSIQEDDPKARMQIHHVLKNAVASYAQQHSNVDVRHIHGEKWQALLRNLYSGRQKVEVCEALCKLSLWQYDQRIELASNDDLKKAARTWIENALPPKKGVLDV
jgi:hypothetical protein